MCAKHLKIQTAIAAALAAIVCSCSDSPAETEKTVLDFGYYFGEPCEDHTWNMSQPSYVTVRVPDGARKVRVMVKYGDLYYLAAKVESPATEELLQFDLPVDVEDFVVVVDTREYTAHTGDVIDARNDAGDEARLIYYTYAAKLGWIVAAECPNETDFDFNDVVIRIDRCNDGAIEITPLACGTEKQVWIHYLGADDYILSPNAFNGSYLSLNEVNKYNASDHSYNSWFEYQKGAINVNDNQGSDGVKGRSVRVPAEIMGSSYFSMADLSTSIPSGGKDSYDRPLSGLYITVGTHDYFYLDDDTAPGDVIVAGRDAGEEPMMIVIPDVGNADTEREHTGWRWPTENSRIDLVYPMFVSWVYDPMAPWSTFEPSGSGGQPGYIDDEGRYETYGYYER